MFATDTEADLLPAPSSRRDRRRAGAWATDVLGLARRVAAELRGGLSGTGLAAAARGLRRLLDADAVGLADVRGEPVWAGRPPTRPGPPGSSRSAA